MDDWPVVNGLLLHRYSLNADCAGSSGVVVVVLVVAGSSGIVEIHRLRNFLCSCLSTSYFVSGTHKIIIIAKVARAYVTPLCSWACCLRTVVNIYTPVSEGMLTATRYHIPACIMHSLYTRRILLAGLRACTCA